VNIDFKVIAHSEQRYPTVGDWWPDGGTLHFRVSALGNSTWECLVFIHELIEWLICWCLLIDVATVDSFDRDYEEARRRGLTTAPCGCPLRDEPGSDRHAPYHDPHVIATVCEFAVASLLDVDWDAYSRKVNSL
jgi:hypothetical protein